MILNTIKKDSSTTLYCFSPAVMLITFTIEMLLAVYTLARFNKSKSGVLITLILVTLATFQASEYVICEMGYPALAAKIGYVAITLLPAFGVHLIGRFRRDFQWIGLSYGLAAAFSLFFLFMPNAITGAACNGNYVIFTTTLWLSRLYALYYIGLLLLGLWQAIRGYDQAQGQPQRSIFAWMIGGYLSFMVPSGIIYILLPSAQIGTPSIMCGFALILALILAFIVAKIATQLEHNHNSTENH